MAAAKNPIGEANEIAVPVEIIQACLEMKEQTIKRIDSNSFLMEMEEPADTINADVRQIDFEAGSCLFIIMFGECQLVNNWTCQLKGKHVSRREIDVVKCIADGLTNKEIGQRLCISEYTVENHLKSIFRKLDVRNRTSLLGQLVSPSV